MNRARTGALVAGIAAVVALVAFGGYRYAMHRMMGTQTSAAANNAAVPATQEASAGRKVLYWYDPMVPQQKFDKSGKSPFMDMQLVPKYADEGGGDEAGKVSINPRVVQNLGVRSAQATLGSLDAKFEAVGSVGWNERGVVVVQARTAGFVEKLHARSPLDPVAKGAPLVEIFFPEWAGAEEEYLLLRRHPSPEARSLVEGARQRLVLLGMSATDIATVEREGKVLARTTLRSPISGVIAELGVREGMTVAAGATLFRIVDLSSVWVNVEVPETQAAMLIPGSRVEARVAAFPEQVFSGRVGAILPEVSQVTRTVKARIELANPGTRLKPGMFATVSLLSGNARQVVLVPSEAVIRTGERNLVILVEADGKFRRQPVEPGVERGGMSEIRAGLKAGDKVVLSGQFLLDSEANLNAGLARMEALPASPAPTPASGPAPGAAPTAAAMHKGQGVVTGVNAAEGYLELKHDPIASMQWPTMQMGFSVPDKAQLAGLKKGDTVEFMMRGQPNKDGDFIIDKVTPRPVPARKP